MSKNPCPLCLEDYRAEKAINVNILVIVFGEDFPNETLKGRYYYLHFIDKKTEHRNVMKFTQPGTGRPRIQIQV